MRKHKFTLIYIAIGLAFVSMIFVIMAYSLNHDKSKLYPVALPFMILMMSYNQLQQCRNENCTSSNRMK
jgi:hypothetical protein